MVAHSTCGSTSMPTSKKIKVFTPNPGNIPKSFSRVTRLEAEGVANPQIANHKTGNDDRDRA